jgi:predicted nucleic acid-binding protein
MAGLIFLFDTNAISDLIEQNTTLADHIRSLQLSAQMILCSPVHYEVKRGLLYTGAQRKSQIYEQEIRPRFHWISLEDVDLELAARYWSDARRRGKQFSDIDLLIAAISVRLNGVIVSADSDFDALPIMRENWRA